MAKSYSFFNRRENIFQPNITRQRIPFNGPISSELLNLYYDQFSLDIARLAKNIEYLEDSLDNANSLTDNRLESATPGYYLDEELEMTIYGQVISYNKDTEEYDIESSTPFYQNLLTYYSPGANAAKISFLKNKLDSLEKKIN